MGNLNQLWIVSAGVNTEDPTRFQAVFDSKSDALQFADDLCNALYPGLILEQQYKTSEGVNYLHPKSVAGDQAFIEVFPYKVSMPDEAIKFFKQFAENKKLWVRDNP